MIVHQLSNIKTNNWTNRIIRSLNNQGCNEHTDYNVGIFQTMKDFFRRKHIVFLNWGEFFMNEEETKQED